MVREQAGERKGQGLALLGRERFQAPTVFTDDVTAHPPLGSSIHGIDQLTALMRGREVAGEYTQHLTTDLPAEVDGDRAAVTANSLVHFFRDGQAPHRTSGLRLVGTAVRTPAGWRLRESRTVLAWMRER